MKEHSCLTLVYMHDLSNISKVDRSLSTHAINESRCKPILLLQHPRLGVFHCHLIALWRETSTHGLLCALQSQLADAEWLAMHAAARLGNALVLSGLMVALRECDLVMRRRRHAIRPEGL